MGCAKYTGHNVGKFVFGKCNGKRPFKRFGHIWETITKDFIGIGRNWLAAKIS